MDLKEFFGGGEDVIKSREVSHDLGRVEKLGKKDQRKLDNARGVVRQHIFKRIGQTLGGGVVAALSVAGVVYLAQTPSKQEHQVPLDSFPADIATPEADPDIELPEFSIKEISYKPSVPEGLDLTPSRFQEVSKEFFGSLEKDFPQFQKDFDGVNDPQVKARLAKEHINKYYDHLLSLDPKIRAHVNSKSMGTLNERCSYMTLFLIGQGRYIGLMNPNFNRQYPQLLYGVSHIKEQMEIRYNGQEVKLPIVEFDTEAGNIPRAWYDYNNQLMMYSPAQNLREAQAMFGTELNAEQVAEFAAALRKSALKHEGTHALTRHMFPKSATEESLQSGHDIPLEKIQIPRTQKDQRHSHLQGLEVYELTAIGIEMAHLPGFLKLYLAKRSPQVINPTQHQQAYLHFLTYLAHRGTVPLPLRLKVQAFLSAFPHGDRRVIAEVMMDPSLPEAELVAIGKHLFAAGIRMFESMEQE